MTDMSHTGFEETAAPPDARTSALMSGIDLVSAYVSHNAIDSAKVVPFLTEVATFIDSWLGGSAKGANAAPAAAFTAQTGEALRGGEAAQVQQSALGQAEMPIETPAASPAKAASARTAARPEPAVPIKDSAPSHGEYIICLEDGQKMKVLKRHLKKKYNMTPDEYRKRWNLPPDYPMTAAKYSEARSSLAKNMGFGKRKTAQAAE